jgi:GntR family transcriptional regulator
MGDVDVAALLKIPLNAPVAKVDRVAVDRNGFILYAGHGVYRGDAISMEIELR